MEDFVPMAANPKIIYECDSRESLPLKNEDRRIYFREKVLLSDLQLEDGSRGIVLDIGEQGLAMQSARPLDKQSNTRLRFQLSQSTKWIDVEGRLAWISPSRCAAGVEFSDLSYDGLVAIKTWMFEIASLKTDEELEIDLSDAADSPTGSDEPLPKSETTESLAQELADYVILGGSVDERINGAECNEEKVELDLQPLSEELSPTEIAFEPRIPELVLLRPLVRKRTGVAAQWPARIAWTLWATIVASGFWGLHLRPVNSQLHEQTAGGQRTEINSSEPPNAVQPRKPGAPQPSTSPDDFGFVLQVAAMQSESSALAIADVFRAKNLSVFVMKPAKGNLYLVLIGPYGDNASAATARAELKSKGFDAIQRRTSSLQ